MKKILTFYLVAALLFLGGFTTCTAAVTPDQVADFAQGSFLNQYGNYALGREIHFGYLAAEGGGFNVDGTFYTEVSREDTADGVILKLSNPRRTIFNMVLERRDVDGETCYEYRNDYTQRIIYSSLAEGLPKE